MNELDINVGQCREYVGAALRIAQGGHPLLLADGEFDACHS